MSTIAIVVLNWNQPALTIDTVNSLLKITLSTGSKYKIIIVDNGSTDNSYKTISNKYKNTSLVELLETGSNLGYVDGNNFGIKYALKNIYKYILIINNDVIVKPDFLKILLQYHQNNNQYDLLAPKIYFAPGHEYHQGRYKKSDLGKVIWSMGGKLDKNNVYGSNIGIDDVDHGQYNKSNNSYDFLSGCCLFAPITTFKKYGLFDSRYFMYLEDLDYSQRLLKQGGLITVVPEAIIWHINAGSSTAGGGALHDYFLTRNRMLFGFTYSSFRTKFALLREAFKILIFDSSSWRKRGIVDFFKGKFNIGSWI